MTVSGKAVCSGSVGSPTATVGSSGTRGSSEKGKRKDKTERASVRRNMKLPHSIDSRPRPKVKREQPYRPPDSNSYFANQLPRRAARRKRTFADDEAILSEEDSADNEQHGLAMDKPSEFVPPPITYEDLREFKRRLEQAVAGHQSAEERLITLDLGVKALEKTMANLSSSVIDSLSISDPIMHKYNQLDKQKKKIIKRITVIKGYLKKNKERLDVFKDGLHKAESKIKGNL